MTVHMNIRQLGHHFLSSIVKNLRPFVKSLFLRCPGWGWGFGGGRERLLKTRLVLLYGKRMDIGSNVSTANIQNGGARVIE